MFLHDRPRRRASLLSTASTSLLPVSAKNICYISLRITVEILDKYGRLALDADDNYCLCSMYAQVKLFEFEYTQTVAVGLLGLIM